MIPIGTEDGIQELMCFRRGVGGAVAEPGLACRFVPLVAGVADEDGEGPAGAADPEGSGPVS